jgi:hypothetical protein
MLLEFTVVLPNGDSFKKRVEAADETAGRIIVEAEHGTGTCPYPCKVIFVPGSN